MWFANIPNLAQIPYKQCTLALICGNILVLTFPLLIMSIFSFLGCDVFSKSKNLLILKADFHSAENVARSTFPARFLLKCVH